MEGEPFLWHVRDPSLIVVRYGSGSRDDSLDSLSLFFSLVLFNLLNGFSNCLLLEDLFLFTTCLFLLFFFVFFFGSLGFNNCWVWSWLGLFLGSIKSILLSFFGSLISGNLLCNVRLWSWDFNLWFGWIRGLLTDNILYLFDLFLSLFYLFDGFNNWLSLFNLFNNLFFFFSLLDAIIFSIGSNFVLGLLEFFFVMWASFAFFSAFFIGFLVFLQLLLVFFLFSSLSKIINS